MTKDEAFAILEQHIDSLGDPPDPFGLPDYLFEPLEFSTEFVLRKHHCLAFKLVEPADGIVGFILDVTDNVSRPKRLDSGPDPLSLIR